MQQRAARMALAKRMDDLARDEVLARMVWTDRQKAAQAILDSLDADTPDGWSILRQTLSQTLSDGEQAKLMVSIYLSMPATVAAKVLKALGEDVMVPEFATDADRKLAFEAWSEVADPADLKAAAFYSIKKMHPKDRAALKRWLGAV